MRQNEHLMEPEELMAYLDGELPPDRAVTASAHIERCRQCQERAADFQSVSRQLGTWQIEPLEQEIPQCVTAALDSRSEGKAVSSRISGVRWRIRPWALGLAGTCLILIWLVAPRPRADVLQFSHPSSFLLASRGRLQDMRATQPAKVVPGKPMIVRAAQLAVITSAFDQARGRIDDILKRHHGYIGELSVTAPAGAARALEATLRVSADQLDSALAELKELGRVELESQSGEEVTNQHVDLEARLSNARKTEQRLNEILLHRTGRLADVLAVEKEMDQIRGEIERMEAEKKGLTNRVDFATLNLKVTEEYKAELLGSGSSLPRLRNALVEGYRTMADGCLYALLFLLVYGPSLLILAALLFFPFRFAWRKLRG